MHTVTTTTVAREIVADRIRQADARRLARAARRTTTDAVPQQPQRPAGVGWTRRFRRFHVLPAH
ncbi:hypothetical protein [Marmoricola sp. RAF53]|uniref:hypothetical protein n=1 Tax=Marmoricola sp. RAF53 TaxID=3233059 RepID=UPI003F9DE79F